MLGPILEGERVRLEPPRPEYLPAYQRWFADMEVTRYLLYRFPFTTKSEEEWLEQVGRDPSQVMWAIVLKHNGRLIGNAALEHIDWRNRRGESGTVAVCVSRHGQVCGEEAVQEIRAVHGEFALAADPDAPDPEPPGVEGGLDIELLDDGFD